MNLQKLKKLRKTQTYNCTKQKVVNLKTTFLFILYIMGVTSNYLCIPGYAQSPDALPKSLNITNFSFDETFMASSIVL